MREFARVIDEYDDTSILVRPVGGDTWFPYVRVVQFDDSKHILAALRAYEEAKNA